MKKDKLKKELEENNITISSLKSQNEHCRNNIKEKHAENLRVNEELRVLKNELEAYKLKEANREVANDLAKKEIKGYNECIERLKTETKRLLEDKKSLKKELDIHKSIKENQEKILNGLIESLEKKVDRYKYSIDKIKKLSSKLRFYNVESFKDKLEKIS